MPHLDHREQLPRPRLEQVLGEREAAVGHLVELLEQPGLVLRAEVLHVEHVLADDVGHLVLEARRVRVRALDRRREEARDQRAAQRPRRVRAGDADDDRGAARPPDEIPEPRRLDGAAVGDEPPVVRVVGAVAKAVDAEVARRPARHHARPRRHRDRRDDRRQPAVDAASISPASVGSSSRHASTSDGSALSRPMIIALFARASATGAHDRNRAAFDGHELRDGLQQAVSRCRAHDLRRTSTDSRLAHRRFVSTAGTSSRVPTSATTPCSPVACTEPTRA